MLAPAARSTALAVLALALLVAPAPVLALARKTHGAMTRDSVEHHILPRLEGLSTAAGELATHVDQLCAKDVGTPPQASATAAFTKTVEAWGAVDFLRFGPMTEDRRLERFFFWPDPRAVTDRQLRQVLAKRDPALVEAATLQQQSVAIQGLGALEILLFDEQRPLRQDSEDGAYRCRLASAIATNLATIARQISEAWTRPEGWRDRLLRPGSDNPYYQDSAESARELVKALLVGMQLSQDRQVLPLIAAATADPPNRVRLPFQRSRLSIAYFDARTQSLEQLYDQLGLAAYVPPDKRWMETFIPRAFKNLKEDAAKLARVGPLDADTRERYLSLVRRMRFSLNGMRQILAREVAPAAELVLGFNELDGD